jgi:hypothetical protein
MKFVEFQNGCSNTVITLRTAFVEVVQHLPEQKPPLFLYLLKLGYTVPRCKRDILLERLVAS